MHYGVSSRHRVSFHARFVTFRPLRQCYNSAVREPADRFDRRSLARKTTEPAHLKFLMTRRFAEPIARRMARHEIPKERFHEVFVSWSFRCSFVSCNLCRIFRGASLRAA